MSTAPAAITEQTVTEPADVIVRGNASGFLQDIVSGKHQLRADEPLSVGGGDAAPGPYDYLLIGLGACTSMTVGLYARRKKWPLEDITVSLRHSRIHAKDCEECETKVGMLDRIDVEVGLSGALTAEQHAKLMEIAAICPVHRTLTSEINIRLQAAPNTSTHQAADTKNLTDKWIKNRKGN
jgi:putative redox protein